MSVGQRLLCCIFPSRKRSERVRTVVFITPTPGIIAILTEEESSFESGEGEFFRAKVAPKWNHPCHRGFMFP